MSHKHKHHNSKKSVRKDKPHVDLKLKKIWIEYDTYVWETKERYDSFSRLVGIDTRWYRISKTRIKKDGKEIPIVPLADRKSTDKKGKISWVDVLRRIRDHKVIEILEHAKDRAEEKQNNLRRAELHRKQKEDRKQRRLQKTLFAADSEGRSASASEEHEAAASASEEHETPWQKHNRPPAKGGEIKRDKYGVKLYSQPDKRFFLQVTVNNSKKFPGNTSVRFHIGGKPWLYTFDLEAMEALRKEFARGAQHKRA